MIKLDRVHARDLSSEVVGNKSWDFTKSYAEDHVVLRWSCELVVSSFRRVLSRLRRREDKVGESGTLQAAEL